MILTVANSPGAAGTSAEKLTILLVRVRPVSSSALLRLGPSTSSSTSVPTSRRGHDYREILAHYYGGATLERLPAP